MSVNAMARRFTTKATGLLPVLILLICSGCAFDHLLVEKTDLKDLALQIDEQQALQDQRQTQLLKSLEQKLERRQAELLARQLETQQQLLESRQFVENGLLTLEEQQKQLTLKQSRLDKFIRSSQFQNRVKESQGLGLQQTDSQIAAKGKKQVVGAVEKVFLAPPGILLPARIDTGATTSSLDAENLEYFERNGQEWVRFSLIHPDTKADSILERKVVRIVRIIQAVAEEPERRPVVEMGVIIGNKTQTAEFTLSTRRHLEYSLLIGRNILRDLFVVDVSQSNIAPPLLPVEKTPDKKPL